MKKQTAIRIFFCFAGCFAFVLVVGLWLKSFNTRHGYWEAEIGNAGPALAFTIRLAQSESDHQSRRIVFTGIDASVVKPGIFKLPDEAAGMQGIRMAFQDITIRPGRVTLELKGHELDIMQSGISIDGENYAWDQLEPIKIPD